mmetsp:Transcript_99970/g.322326  ORF Transcript_99970/g.322326 Transcript_99970/m.322326 type:complete len:223 (-) Transcript_99970:63-731(-)
MGGCRLKAKAPRTTLWTAFRAAGCTACTVLPGARAATPPWTRGVCASASASCSERSCSRDDKLNSGELMPSDGLLLALRSPEKRSPSMAPARQQKLATTNTAHHHQLPSSCTTPVAPAEPKALLTPCRPTATTPCGACLAASAVALGGAGTSWSLPCSQHSGHAATAPLAENWELLRWPPPSRAPRQPSATSRQSRGPATNPGARARAVPGPPRRHSLEAPR